MAERRTKDIWDILKAISVVAIVPLVGWLGQQANVTIKERDAQIKTLELAMSVLAQDPSENEGTPELRKWAMDVVDAYSGVPLTKPARVELERQPAPLPQSRLDELSDVYKVLKRLERGERATEM